MTAVTINLAYDGMELNPSSVSASVNPGFGIQEHQANIQMGGGHWGWGPAYQLHISDGITDTYYSDPLKQPESVVSDGTYFYVGEQSGDAIRKIDYQGNTIETYSVNEPRYLARYQGYLFSTYATFGMGLHLINTDTSEVSFISVSIFEDWAEYSIPYTALISIDGDNLVLGIPNTDGSGTVEAYFYDAQSVIDAAPVPEPSTFALIFGAVALGFVISRRK
jgi:hypothetical protein